jgi:hypothetical protein
MLLKETDSPLDFALLDIGETESEFTRVSSGQTAASVIVPRGMSALYTTIRETTEMKQEEVVNALPLLASKTLEDQVARRLMQGIVSAARMVQEDIVKKALGDVQPVVPVLGSVPAVDAACGQLLFNAMPFAAVLPPGDMPKMASMVGL